MSRRWVVNASPLIALANISLIPFVETLCDELIIPAGVADEIQAGPDHDLAKQWLEKSGQRHILEVGVPDTVVMSWDLGKGETEVISYAHTNPGVEAILDDRAARTCASALGIPVRGTLGVILLAKKLGHVPAVKPLLLHLQQAGFRIGAEQINSVLLIAGESTED